MPLNSPTMMTLRELLELLEQRSAETKAHQRATQGYFGPTVAEPVELSIEEADAAVACLRELKAKGSIT